MSTALTVAATRSISATLTDAENQIVQQAISIVTERLFQRGKPVGNPREVQDYLRLTLMAEKRETFGVLFLDAGHRPIAFEILSCGTLTHAQVYPREVMERVLFHNAESIILAHNNPSGRCESPSTADELVTRRLQEMLAMIDVKILDHFVIGEDTSYSFAEHGLL